MSVADALATVDTEYTADSIEFCPHAGSEQYFTCGTYQVIPVTKPTKAENGDTNGATENGQVIGSPTNGSNTEYSKVVDGDDSESDADEATPPAPRVGRLYLFKLDGDTP